MSKSPDPSWTPSGFLADLDAMPKKQRRQAAKQLLELLAQAEQWQQRGATPQRWDELVAELRNRDERIGRLNSRLAELEGLTAAARIPHPDLGRDNEAPRGMPH